MNVCTCSSHQFVQCRGQESLGSGWVCEKSLEQPAIAGAPQLVSEPNFKDLVFVDVNAVDHELARAKMHGETFASLHEAYSVILEELDEIWDHTRKKRRDRSRDELRAEFIQLAAMAHKGLASLDHFVGGAV